MLQKDKDHHCSISSDHADEETTNKMDAGIWFGAGVLLLLGLWMGIEISTIGASLVFAIPVAVFAILSVVRCKESPVRMGWVLGAVIGMIGAYFLWKNVIIFERDIGAWVADNCTFAVMFVSVTSAFFNKRWIAAFTLAGYNLGVIAGGLFGRVSYDPGGGTLHNGWLIWIFVFLGFFFLGCIAEVVFHAIRKRQIGNS